MGRIKPTLVVAVFLMIACTPLLVPSEKASTTPDGYGAPIADHGPIHITNETDLEEQVDSEGWDGNGTAIDPYVIEDMMINGGGTSIGLKIEKTESHILISNVSITNVGTSGFYYIYLVEASNITIRNCSLTDFTGGVLMDTCSHILVEDCYFKNVTYGVRNMRYSENLTVKGSDFIENNIGVFNFQMIENCYFYDCNEGARGGPSKYTIRNCIFTDQYQALTGYGDHFVIENNTITDSDSGIMVTRSRDGIIRNNTINRATFSGIHISDTEGLTFHSNDLTDCYLRILGDRNSFCMNTISENNTVNQKPIYHYSNENLDNESIRSGFGQLIVGNVSWFSLDNLTVSDLVVPITIAYSSNFTIADNTILNNTRGISLYQSQDVEILRNNVSSNFDYGIILRGCLRTRISGNTVMFNVYTGLSLNGRKLLVENNLISYTEQVGLWISCDGAVIRNNRIENNNWSGIRIWSDFHSNRITENTISGNGQAGIWMNDGPSENMIMGNNFSKNGQYGVYIHQAPLNKIIGNEFYDNGEFGIYVNYTQEISISYTSIYSNEMYLDGINFNYGNGYVFSSSRIVSNNTLNGKPIRIFYGGSLGSYIVPKNTGQLILLGVSNLKIEKLEISHASAAVVTKTSSSINIRDCYFHHNKVGVLLTSSPNAILASCNFSENLIGIRSNWGSGSDSGSGRFTKNEFFSNEHHGIFLQSHRNSIDGNLFSYNGIAGIFGQQVNDNIISGNDFISNKNGIKFRWCYTNQQVTRNLFFRNVGYGIWVNSTDWGYPNEFKMNVFIDNNGATETYDPDHAQAFDLQGRDMWNGTEEPGNYWSDWLSPDNDFDGVVDDPYPIGGGLALDHKARISHPFIILSRPRYIGAVGGNGYVNLSWTEPEIDRGQEVTGYHIYRGQMSGMEELIASIGTFLEYNDTSVENGKQYFYYIRAENLFGQGSKSLEVDAWTDGEPPSLFILEPRNRPYFNIDQVSVRWQVSDDVSGLSHVDIYLDGNKTGTIYTQTQYHFSNLENGHHKVNLEAFDNYGNSDTASVDFTVDTELPQIEIFTPEPDSLFNSTSIPMGWNGYDEFSGIDRYFLKIDQGNWMDMGQDTSYVLDIQHDGDHTIMLSALDRANNSNTTMITLTLDFGDPTLHLSYPLEGMYLNQTEAMVEWNGEDSLSGIGGSLISVNGGEFFVPDGLQGHMVSGLSDGLNTVTIRIFDAAGNFIEKTVQFHVDTVAPEVLSHDPIGDSIHREASIVVEFSEFLEPSHFQFDAVGKVGQMEWDDLTLTFTPFSPWQGGMTVEVIITGKDRAGNSLSPFSWTFTVDDSSRIFGIVTDDKGVLLGDVSIIMEGEEIGRSDSLGDFDLWIPSGEHELIFRREGFEDFTRIVVLEPGGSEEITGITLTRSITEPVGGTEGNDAAIFIVIGIIILVVVIAIIVLLLIVRSKKSHGTEEEEPEEPDPFETAEALRSEAQMKGLYILGLEEVYNEALKRREINDPVGALESIVPYNDALTNLLFEYNEKQDQPDEITNNQLPEANMEIPDEGYDISADPFPIDTSSEEEDSLEEHENTEGSILDDIL